MVRGTACIRRSNSAPGDSQGSWPCARSTCRLQQGRSFFNEIIIVKSGCFSASGGEVSQMDPALLPNPTWEGRVRGMAADRAIVAGGIRAGRPFGLAAWRGRCAARSARWCRQSSRRSCVLENNLMRKSGMCDGNRKGLVSSVSGFSHSMSCCALRAFFSAFQIDIFII